MNLNLSVVHLARSGLLSPSNYLVTRHHSQNSFKNCHFSKFSSTLFNLRKFSFISFENTLFEKGNSVLVSGFDQNAVNDNALNYQEYTSALNLTASALFKGCKFLSISAGNDTYAPLVLNNHSIQIDNCIFDSTNGLTAGAIYCKLTSLHIQSTNFTNCHSTNGAGVAYFLDTTEPSQIVGVVIVDCFCKDQKNNTDEAAHIFYFNNSDYVLGQFLIEYSEKNFSENNINNSVPFFSTNDVDFAAFTIGEIMLPYENITIFDFKNVLLCDIHQLAFIAIKKGSNFIKMQDSQVLVKSVCSSTDDWGKLQAINPKNKPFTGDDEEGGLFVVNDTSVHFGEEGCNYELAKADIQKPTAKLTGLDLTLSIVTCVIFFVFFIAAFSVLIALVFCHIGSIQEEEEDEPDDNGEDISFGSFTN